MVKLILIAFQNLNIVEFEFRPVQYLLNKEKYFEYRKVICSSNSNLQLDICDLIIYKTSFLFKNN